MSVIDTSMSQRVYNEIRERIIRGDFPPGFRLLERDLADEFAVSRVPVREALPQLEADGFITTLPRRGAVVSQLTIQDVEELFDVRLGVEVYATRLAARKLSRGADPTRLRAAMTRCDDATTRNDPVDITASNSALHDVIVELSGNELIISMMRPVRGRHLWIFGRTAGSAPQRACIEHHDLCEALYAGDEDLAGAIAYAHIDRGRKPAIEALRNVLPDRHQQ